MLRFPPLTFVKLSKRVVYLNNVSMSFFFNQLVETASSKSSSLMISIRFLTKLDVKFVSFFSSNLCGRPLFSSLYSYRVSARLSSPPGVYWFNTLFQEKRHFFERTLKSTFSFFKGIQVNGYNYLFGFLDKIEVTGYSRKMWLGKSKKVLFLQIGKSYISKILIPRNIHIALLRRRILLLFSNNVAVLRKFTLSVFFLRPADPYKLAGILLKSKIIKQRLKKKK